MYFNVCNLFVCFNDDDYDNDCILCLGYSVSSRSAHSVAVRFSYMTGMVLKSAANISTAYQLPYDALWAFMRSMV